MDRNTKLSIAALLIAAFTIGIDFTGALFLVPPIERQFSADITTTQWVLNLYALTFAMFMVAGGRLSDMYGRRLLLLTGLVIFVAACLGCWLSPSMAWLIGARAVQGVGAAIMWPCILALGATLVEEKRRSLVMGLIMAGVTSGNVFGPLISGIVVSLGDWRLFFLISALLGGTVAVLVPWLLPKDLPGGARERVDYLGMTVLAAAIMVLLYSLDVGADWGWRSPPLIALLVLSAILFAVFPLIEARVAEPLMPRALMHNKEFMLALSTNGLLVPAIFIAFLYFPQYLQKVLGWSVLESSFGMLPLMGLLAVGSIFSGRFYDDLGPKRLLFFGYLLVTLGALTVVLLRPSWGYFAILPAMVLIGFGGSITVGSAGTAAVATVTPARAGLAGGLSFMVHLSLGALGVAGATAIMYASSLSSLGHGLARAGVSMTPAHQALLNTDSADSADVRMVLASYDPETLGAIHASLTDSFSVGMSDAYWLALLAAVLGILAVLAIDETELKRVHG